MSHGQEKKWSVQTNQPQDDSDIGICKINKNRFL